MHEEKCVDFLLPMVANVSNVLVYSTMKDSINNWLSLECDLIIYPYNEVILSTLNISFHNFALISPKRSRTNRDITMIEWKLWSHSQQIGSPI